MGGAVDSLGQAAHDGCSRRARPAAMSSARWRPSADGFLVPTTATLRSSSVSDVPGKQDGGLWWMVSRCDGYSGSSRVTSWRRFLVQASISWWHCSSASSLSWLSSSARKTRSGVRLARAHQHGHRAAVYLHRASATAPQPDFRLRTSASKEACSVSLSIAPRYRTHQPLNGDVLSIKCIYSFQRPTQCDVLETACHTLPVRHTSARSRFPRVITESPFAMQG